MYEHARTVTAHGSADYGCSVWSRTVHGKSTDFVVEGGNYFYRR